MEEAHQQVVVYDARDIVYDRLSVISVNGSCLKSIIAGCESLSNS